MMETFDALVRRIALLSGVDDIAAKDTIELVWAIQKKEGNTPCFRTRQNCPQTDCLWREQCIFHWRRIEIAPKGEKTND